MGVRSAVPTDRIGDQTAFGRCLFKGEKMRWAIVLGIILYFSATRTMDFQRYGI